MSDAPIALTVERAGPQTTIQDGGRPGHLGLGIPPSGPQDRYSFVAANRIVGNRLPPPLLSLGEPGAAGLEILLGGVVLRFARPTVVCVSGGELDKLELNRTAVDPWRPIEVQSEDVLSFGRVKRGLRTYLAIRGGLDVPRWLGSRSTYVQAGQGGFEGRALAPGDALLAATDEDPAMQPSALAELPIPEIHNRTTLRVTLGPQDDLFEESSVEAFLESEWKMTPQTNRLGMRLSGPELQFRPRADYLVAQAGAGASNIVDDVSPIGGIQAPDGKQLIVFGVDVPSAGGYAKIGTVVSSDIDRLGQIRPGAPVSFQAIELAEALDIADRKNRELYGGRF